MIASVAAIAMRCHVLQRSIIKRIGHKSLLRASERCRQ
jgi:hypothetical protein